MLVTSTLSANSAAARPESSAEIIGDLATGVRDAGGGLGCAGAGSALQRSSGTLCPRRQDQWKLPLSAGRPALSPKQDSSLQSMTPGSESRTRALAMTQTDGCRTHRRARP